MRYSFVVATVLITLLSGLAQAKQAVTSVVVQAPQITFAKWSNQVTGRIERNLDYPSGVMNRERRSGIVSVLFQSSDTGRPSSVSISHMSGDAALDRAALNAVTHIKSLYPLPATFGPGQRFVANILFANDQSDHDRLLAGMHKDAIALNARLRQDGEVIALNISSGAGVTAQSGN